MRENTRNSYCFVCCKKLVSGSKLSVFSYFIIFLLYCGEKGGGWKREAEGTIPNL